MTARRIGLTALLAAVLLLGAGLAATRIAAAGSSSGYSIGWFTVDGGGGASASSGSYSVGGSAGQPDAGTLTGNAYTLRGGFWVPSPAARLFLPLVRR